MKKLVSVWLAYCILIMQSGCTTKRTLSMSEVSIHHTKKTSLVLHTPNSRYQLLDFKFTDDALVGNLEEYSGKNANILHVFTDLNFYYNPYQKIHQSINVPKSNIQKIKYSKFDGIKTFMLIGGLVATLIILGTNSISYNFNWGD
ncbi:MAG TPA: hypothetical protein DCR40_20615 [Prolixibacteraceae bacterium]|nr:hypothetical protein [Prolixibacteraceae bacterium]